MLASIFIFTVNGEAIIEKNFRERTPRSAVEDFWHTYIAPHNTVEDAPTVTNTTKYTFVKHVVNNVVFLAVCHCETPPMMVLEILNMVSRTFTIYLKELNEETIRENFSVVYQLLEEMVDNGFPLTTDVHVLEDLVPPPTLENKVRNMLDTQASGSRTNHDAAAVPWRSANIKYATNEILFDVIEEMDVLIDNEGNIVSSSINGSIEASCLLSGMPDIAMHIHNAEIFDDVCYHRCVRHSRYEADRTLSFVPPDKRFTLFKYRCKPFHSLQPPFYVTPQITYHKDGGRINVMVGMRHGGVTLSDKEKEVHKLSINIPLPQHTDSVSIGQCTQGVYSFDHTKKVLVWRIGHLGNNATPSLSGEINFKLHQAEEALSEGTGESVGVEFVMPNYAISGIKVDSVNVLNESYKPYKGVKYITRGGRFFVRTV